MLRNYISLKQKNKFRKNRYNLSSGYVYDNRSKVEYFIIFTAKYKNEIRIGRTTKYLYVSRATYIKEHSFLLKNYFIENLRIKLYHISYYT